MQRFIKSSLNSSHRRSLSRRSIATPTCHATSLAPPPPSRSSAPRIDELIARRELSAVFQPIIDFEDGAILGYEGLIRGPAGSAARSAVRARSQALAEGCTIELEQAAARACIDAFPQLGRDGKLFLNFSAGALRLADAPDETLAPVAATAAMWTCNAS